VDDPGRLPQAWDACVSGAGHLLQRRRLGVLAAAPLPGARILCGLAWSGEDLVAAGVFHLVPFQPGRTGRTVSEGHWLTGTFLRLTGLLSSAPPHMLLCGHWLHTDARGFTCAPDHPNPAGTLHAMMRAARKHGGVPVGVEVVKGPDLAADGAALGDRGYHRVDASQPTMRVPVDPAWGDWQGYLGAMRKKYRQRARAARKRGAAIEREVLDAQQVRQHADTLDALLEPVLENAEVVLAPPRASTLASMKRILGPRLQVVLYRHEGVPVGFAACLCRDDALEGLLVGLDPEANRGLKLYQNILYDFVERAMEAGVPVLELGRTALEIKSAVGAEPWSYPVWVRNENGLLNWILGLAAARLRPPAWEPRNVFRTLAPPDGVVAQAG
jgi:hypothetical protein